MLELLDRFENFCKISGIDFDKVLNTLNEPQRVDNIDVIDKNNSKMQILKNVFKQFLQAEEQKISDEHLEFIIKISNLV
jgi:hypothetical protein